MRVAAADVIRQVLTENEIEFTEKDSVFTADLPGERKLKTTVTLTVGPQAVQVHAFVARHPDENHEAVYRWLLERNLKMYGVAFAVDHLGDIHLDGRVPLHAITPVEVDRLLGAVLEYADTSFNTILELGFASSIRREYDWRVSRGESTRNLDAFKGWLEPR
ncbi:YbjN domain-containing protein [Kribbella sp. NPDC058693]|uniref:YbjN domain-containing protein n=1 Tax=Kribbella jiaozuonensis TaxID=2575441 RepID=A0A4U3M3E2_9ACTN|nr:YbjN domain-containing protein [Kribbella jiaozuonensis]TKK81816.1 YbjN domain-containing protein [Kribbella jiaozuonensis]